MIRRSRVHAAAPSHETADPKAAPSVLSRRKKSALNRMATRMQKPIHTLAVSVRESWCMDAG